MANNFWQRVQECDHSWNPNYIKMSYRCDCRDATESHCLKCGVYKTDDPCGEFTGFAGWPRSRRRAYKSKPQSILNQ